MYIIKQIKKLFQGGDGEVHYFSGIVCIDLFKVDQTFWHAKT